MLQKWLAEKILEDYDPLEGEPLVFVMRRKEIGSSLGFFNICLLPFILSISFTEAAWSAVISIPLGLSWFISVCFQKKGK